MSIASTGQHRLFAALPSKNPQFYSPFPACHSPSPPRPFTKFAAQIASPARPWKSHKVGVTKVTHQSIADIAAISS